MRTTFKLLIAVLAVLLVCNVMALKCPDCQKERDTLLRGICLDCHSANDRKAKEAKEASQSSKSRYKSDEEKWDSECNTHVSLFHHDIYRLTSFSVRKYSDKYDV